MAGGQVSAEVTFNSAELESWNLWSRCRRPWDDLGMVIRDKPEIVLSYPHPSISCHSSASQWSSLWPFGIQVALSITGPSMNPMVSAMYTLLPGQPFPYPCLSRDTLLEFLFQIPCICGHAWLASIFLGLLDSVDSRAGICWGFKGTQDCEAGSAPRAVSSPARTQTWKV